MFTQITRILLRTLGFACLLITGIACDLEVIPDNFVGGPDNGAPRACFTVDRTTCTLGDCNLIFDALCSENETNYRWDFNNDGLFEIEGVGERSPNFEFTEAGVSIVHLVVEDAMSRTGDTTITVTVLAPELVTFEETDPTVKGAKAMALLEDGSVLIAGSKEREIYLRRIDPEGQVTLENCYTVPGVVTVQDLTVLSDGTYVVVGNYVEDGTNDTKALYLRAATSGTALNGPMAIAVLEDQTMGRVAELPNGHILFLSTERREFTQGVDIVLTRMSANLITLFGVDKLVGAGESFLSIGDVEVLNNGFIVVGSSFSIFNGTRGLVAKFDLTGNIAADHPRYFSSGSSQRLTCITKMGEDDFLTAGTISPGSDHILLIRMNSDGVASDGYPDFLSIEGDQVPHDIQATPDGGAIIGGEDLEKAMFLKLNSDGTEEWREPRDLTGDAAFLRVAATPDGGYIGAGFRGASLYYAKTDAEGLVE
jgi:PKD repeat protein